MNIGSAFSQLTDITGLASVSKWFSGFDDTGLDDFAKLLKEWPDCPPSIKAELEQGHPPPKGRIHHHLVAARNDPVAALQHVKLITSIREAFRKHICSGAGSRGERFKNFRSAILASSEHESPERDVIRELSAGKIALVGRSENGRISYLLHGKAHLPSESEGGFPRDCSIRVGALVLGRLALLAQEKSTSLSSGTDEETPPTDVNVIVDLTDTGLGNLDRGFGLTMGELIAATNLREGDDPIPSAPCVRFSKMIIINASWIYTAVWAMVRPFVGQEWLDIIVFDSPSNVPELVHIAASRLPTSLGGTIPEAALLQPSAAAAHAEDAGAQQGAPAGVGGLADAIAEPSDAFAVPSGTSQWFAATATFFVDPPAAWQDAVPSLDATQGLLLVQP